jgi:hypothetical protein
VSYNVKGDTLVEYEIPDREIRNTKRTLTAIMALSAIISGACVVFRVIAGSETHDLPKPLIESLGAGIIIGSFVALLAFNSRLQIQLDYKSESHRPARLSQLATNVSTELVVDNSREIETTCLIKLPTQKGDSEIASLAFDGSPLLVQSSGLVSFPALTSQSTVNVTD